VVAVPSLEKYPAIVLRDDDAAQDAERPVFVKQNFILTSTVTCIHWGSILQADSRCAHWVERDARFNEKTADRAERVA
jgi:hypothetical protein